MIIQFFILVALVRLLIVTDKPLLCAGIYTSVAFVLGLFAVTGGHATLLALLIATIIRFALSSLYFWLLYRIGDGALWWVVLVVGFAIALV